MPRFAEEPKLSGGRAEEPKLSGGREDPKLSKGRGGSRAGGAGPGGCASGWVVVSFISPTCANVSELAARILTGQQESAPVAPAGKQFSDLAVEAQQKTRRQERDRERIDSDRRQHSQPWPDAQPGDKVTPGEHPK